MFIGSFKKSFALKNDYLKHLRERLLVNVDHKYPLYCNQPKCNYGQFKTAQSTPFVSRKKQLKVIQFLFYYDDLETKSASADRGLQNRPVLCNYTAVVAFLARYHPISVVVAVPIPSPSLWDAVTSTVKKRTLS